MGVAHTHRWGWGQAAILTVLASVAIGALALQLEWGKPEPTNRPAAEAPLYEALGDLASWPPELTARLNEVRTQLGRLTQGTTTTPQAAQLPDAWRLTAISPLAPLPPARAFLAESSESCAVCLTADCSKRATTTPRVTLALYPATTTAELLPILATPWPAGQCAPALVATSTALTIVDLCANTPKCPSVNIIQDRLIQQLLQTP